MRSKKYGQYQILNCPFCTNQATVKNEQKVPVCDVHRKQVLPDLKCSCGSYVELAIGKWGAYFKCLKCGNVPFRRIMELNDLKATPIKKEPVKKEAVKKHVPTETVVRSDELDFL